MALVQWWSRFTWNVEPDSLRTEVLKVDRTLTETLSEEVEEEEDEDECCHGGGLELEPAAAASAEHQQDQG